MKGEETSDFKRKRKGWVKREKPAQEKGKREVKNIVQFLIPLP